MINKKEFKNVGIVGYGGYVPRFRLRVAEVARVWGKEPAWLEKGLGIKEKAVAGVDEDTVTMAVEAALRAVKMAGIAPAKIGAVLVGSESHPYVVKPTGTIVAQILGVGNDYFCVDLEFACKAGTAGMQMAAAMIESGMIEYGLVIGSDKSQGRPADALEYTAGAGAAAYILGSKKHQWLARLKATSSFSSDTVDFWRRPGENFPSHGGRFTGGPGYFTHVIKGTEKFLKRIKGKIDDFDRVVLHMPNLKFPLRAAEVLGATEKQLKAGLVVKAIGNPYSASAMLGLVATLDKTRKGERVLVTAYGSGAGSDSFVFEVTDKLIKKRRRVIKIEKEIAKKEEIGYAKYLQLTGALLG